MIARTWPAVAVWILVWSLLVLTGCAPTWYLCVPVPTEGGSLVGICKPVSPPRLVPAPPTPEIST